MLRWILLLAALVPLAGCASTYRGYSEPVHVGGGTYYTPAATTVGYVGGDYYHGRSQVSFGYSVGFGSYHYPYWYDYPYYYSLFWPLHRAIYDPYWHPRFYYGVTYYPRNYFSVTFYGGPRHYYSRWRSPYWSFAYSPYRLSWVDYYYDWYPYHRYYPRHVSLWYAPRYGNVRHESERLTRLYRPTWDNRGLPRTTAAWHAGHAGERRADYHGRTAARVDPGVRGFTRGEADLRGRGGYDSRSDARIDPGVRGFDRGDAVVRGGERGWRDEAQRGRIDPGVRGFDRGDAVVRGGERGWRDEAQRGRIDPGVRGFDRGDAVVRGGERGWRDEAERGRIDPGVRGFDRGDAVVRGGERGWRDEAQRSRVDPGVRGFDRGDVRTAHRAPVESASRGYPGALGEPIRNRAMTSGTDTSGPSRHPQSHGSVTPSYPLGHHAAPAPPPRSRGEAQSYSAPRAEAPRRHEAPRASYGEAREAAPERGARRGGRESRYER